MPLLWGLYQFQETFQRLESDCWLEHIIGSVGALNEAQSKWKCFQYMLIISQGASGKGRRPRAFRFIFEFCALVGTSFPISEIYNFSPKTYRHSPEKYFRLLGYSSFLTEGKTETSTLSPGGKMPPVFWHRPWCYTSKSQAGAGRDCMACKAKQVSQHCFKMSDLCTGMRNSHFICSSGRQRSSLLLQLGFQKLEWGQITASITCLAPVQRDFI